MGIVEFLNARIAEDGEATREWPAHLAAPALRDLRAKLAIVADCAEYAGTEAVTDGLSARTLHHLAAIYDSHPDYDPAWEWTR